MAAVISRSHFEATGADTATLDAMAATGINWSQILAIIISILQAFGVSIPTGATVAQVQSAVTKAGINWGTLLATILKVLQTLAPILGGLAGSGGTTVTAP